jgi:hypothetical protein
MFDWLQPSKKIPVVQHENVQDVILTYDKMPKRFGGDVHYTNNFIWLIHVMPSFEETCLISHTLTSIKEEIIINGILDEGTMRKHTFIIYGKNVSDTEQLEKKYHQMISLGFTRIFLYLGGMFEWTLLQQQGGVDGFPTTSAVEDCFEFKIPKLSRL